MIRRRRRQCRSPLRRRRSPFRLSGTREIWLLKWKPHSAAPSLTDRGNARALQEFCTINFNEGDSHIRLLYDRPKIRSGSYATRASKLASSRCPLSLSHSNRARSGGSYLEVLRHDHPRFVLPLSRTLMPIDREGEGGRSGDSLRSP